MGINTSGVPNPNNYLLGRGKVYIAELDSSDLPINFRAVGNAPSVSLSREFESLEHTSSQSGTATVDKEVATSQSTNVSIALDEVEFGNLAMFFAGEAVSQSNAAAATGVTGSSNLTIPASNGQGRWYDLYQTATGAPSTNPHADRIYDIGTVTIAGSTEGTDFEVDQKMGRIFIIEGGNLTAGTHDVDIAANGSAVSTVSVLRAQTGLSQTVAIKFISINPANGDKETEYQMHKVTIKPSGDLALIGDEFAQFTLEGKLESNPNADANSPYMSIVDHTNS